MQKRRCDYASRKNSKAPLPLWGINFKPVCYMVLSSTATVCPPICEHLGRLSDAHWW